MHAPLLPGSLGTAILLLGASLPAAGSARPGGQDADPEAVELFDGGSLDGWVTRGGRYDGEALWSVEDGTIAGREGENHAGGLLYTAQPYASVDLELEVWMEEPFDSGIFLRMRPDAKGAQVTLDYRPDGEVGGIYSDGWYYHNPAGKAAFRGGDWNHFRVRCTGDPMHLEVWMNGTLLTDYRFPGSAEGFAREGLIGLQVHGNRDDPPGSKVLFRNLRARRLPAEAGVEFREDAGGRLALTAAGTAAGWRPLLEEGLPAWEQGGGTDLRLQDAVLEFRGPADAEQRLVGAADRGDLEVRLDYRVAKGVVAGLVPRGVRAQPDTLDWMGIFGDVADDALPAPELPGVVTALSAGAHPAGEWNTLEVLCHEDHVTATLNGTACCDVTPPGDPGVGCLILRRLAHLQAEGDGPWLAVKNFFVRPLGRELPDPDEEREEPR